MRKLRPFCRALATFWLARVSLAFFSCLYFSGLTFATLPADDYSEAELREMIGGKILVEAKGLDDGGQRIIGKGYLAATVEELLEVLLDVNHFPEFMPGFRESSLLREEDIPELSNPDKLRKMSDYFSKVKCERDSSGICFWYERLDFPWPVPDRCAILKAEYDSSGINSHQVVGMFKYLSGGWRFWPEGEGVVAIYHTEADVGIPIPGFVQRIGLDIMLPDVYRAVAKRIIENRKGPR